MKTLLNNNQGFSLLEALVAAVVFIIASMGLFSSFTVQRQSLEHSGRRLQAAIFAQEVLEDLRAKVDQTNWDSGDLQIGGHTVVSADGRYTATYTVSEDAVTKMRKVDLVVSWNEP